MKRSLVVRPEAEVDITKAVCWYEQRQVGLGNELLLEIRSAIGRVLKNPAAFVQVRRKPAVHRILLRRFPYRIFYVIRQTELVVIGRIHVARHKQSSLLRLQSQRST